MTDSEIIAGDLIEYRLDRYRHVFRSACEGLGVSELQGASKQVILLIEAANSSKTQCVCGSVFRLMRFDTKVSYLISFSPCKASRLLKLFDLVTAVELSVVALLHIALS